MSYIPSLEAITTHPEHIAIVDLAEDVIARIEKHGGGSLKEAKELLKRVESPSILYDMDFAYRLIFPGNLFEMPGLYTLAGQILKLHHSVAYADMGSEWKALQVQQNMADFSPEEFINTMESIAAANGIPRDAHQQAMMQMFVFQGYPNHKDIPGAKQEALAAIQASLAQRTSGVAIEAPDHWHKFDPSMVAAFQHKISSTQSEVTYYYGDWSSKGDRVELARFGGTVESHPIYHGGYAMIPRGRDIVKHVHRMFHEGHPDKSLGIEPMVKSSVEDLTAKLREGFDKARELAGGELSPNLALLEARFLAQIGEKPAFYEAQLAATLRESSEPSL